MCWNVKPSRVTALASCWLSTSCGTGTHLQEFDSVNWLCYHLFQQNDCGFLKTQISVKYISISVNSLLVLYHVDPVYSSCFHCVTLMFFHLYGSWFVVGCFKMQNSFIPLLPGTWLPCFIPSRFSRLYMEIQKTSCYIFLFYHSSKEFSKAKQPGHGVFISFATYWGISIYTEHTMETDSWHWEHTSWGLVYLKLSAAFPSNFLICPSPQLTHQVSPLWESKVFWFQQ